MDLMQAAGRWLNGGIAQQHLPPCRQVGQRLSQLNHLSPVFHLLSHVVHLQQQLCEAPA